MNEFIETINNYPRIKKSIDLIIVDKYSKIHTKHNLSVPIIKKFSYDGAIEKMGETVAKLDKDVALGKKNKIFFGSW